MASVTLGDAPREAAASGSLRAMNSGGAADSSGARVAERATNNPKDRLEMDALKMFELRYEVDVRLGAWGQHWARDVLLFGHNALRLELRDVQRVLRDMFSRRLQLGRSELERLLEWWEGFVDLVGEYFDLEELVLFPWLSERTQLRPEHFGIHMRLHMKAKLLLVLRRMDGFHDALVRAAGGEVLPDVAALVQYASEALLEYVDEQERTLVPVIASVYADADAHDYYRRVEKFVVDADRPIELYIFLTRHIRQWRHWNSLAQRILADKQETASNTRHFRLADELAPAKGDGGGGGGGRASSAAAAAMGAGAAAASALISPKPTPFSTHAMRACEPLAESDMNGPPDRLVGTEMSPPARRQQARGSPKTRGRRLD